MIKQIVTEARSIELENEDLNLDQVRQMYYACPEFQKAELVRRLYNELDGMQTIVFLNTRKEADSLQKYLSSNKYLAEVLMGGNMDKEERDRIMYLFKKKEVHFLITTNLLARGIDVEQMPMVINYSIPMRKEGTEMLPDYESFLHRAGRAHAGW